MPPGFTRQIEEARRGLAVCHEVADRDDPGLVFFLGGGYLEVSGVGDGTTAGNLAVWIQVRDLAAEHRRLKAAGIQIVAGTRAGTVGFAGDVDR